MLESSALNLSYFCSHFRSRQRMKHPTNRDECSTTKLVLIFFGAIFTLVLLIRLLTSFTGTVIEVNHKSRDARMLKQIVFNLLNLQRAKSHWHFHARPFREVKRDKLLGITQPPTTMPPPLEKCHVLLYTWQSLAENEELSCNVAQMSADSLGHDVILKTKEIMRNNDVILLHFDRLPTLKQIITLGKKRKRGQKFGVYCPDDSNFDVFFKRYQKHVHWMINYDREENPFQDLHNVCDSIDLVPQDTPRTSTHPESS